MKFLLYLLINVVVAKETLSLPTTIKERAEAAKGAAAAKADEPAKDVRDMRGMWYFPLIYRYRWNRQG